MKMQDVIMSQTYIHTYRQTYIHTDIHTYRQGVEYDIVRALLMILVVLGHCTYYQISTNYGVAYYQDLMLQAGVNDTLIHRIASWVTGVIYTFHMPLFMALSGAVFSLQLSKGKYGE